MIPAPRRVDLYELAMQCRDDSDRWFGDGDIESTRHHLVAMSGEVGEVLEAAVDLIIGTGKIANTLKKIDRGSLIRNDPKTLAHVRDELDDVFTYLLNLAGLFDHDLGAGYMRKRAINDERFMIARAERDRRS